MTKMVSEKILIAIIIISFIFIIIFKSSKNKDNLIPAFSENNLNMTYIVDIEGEGITTKSVDIFKNDIVAIYLNNKRYKNINSGWYNIDNTFSIEKNIELLEKYYIDVLKKNNMNKEIINVELNGISISKIKLITSDISKYKKYKIKKMEYQ